MNNGIDYQKHENMLQRYTSELLEKGRFGEGGTSFLDVKILSRDMLDAALGDDPLYREAVGEDGEFRDVVQVFSKELHESK